MSRRSRPTLEQLRALVLAELDYDWRSVAWLVERLESDHGLGWYRLALTVERLAAGGLIEARGDPLTGRRWFQRRRNA